MILMFLTLYISIWHQNTVKTMIIQNISVNKAPQVRTAPLHVHQCKEQSKIKLNYKTFKTKGIFSKQIIVGANMTHTNVPWKCLTLCEQITKEAKWDNKHVSVTCYDFDNINRWHYYTLLHKLKFSLHDPDWTAVYQKSPQLDNWNTKETLFIVDKSVFCKHVVKHSVYNNTRGVKEFNAMKYEWCL